MKFFATIVLIYFTEILSVSFAQNGEEGLCSKQFEKLLPNWLLSNKKKDGKVVIMDWNLLITQGKIPEDVVITSKTRFICNEIHTKSAGVFQGSQNMIKIRRKAPPDSDEKISEEDKLKEETYNIEGPGVIKKMITKHLGAIEKDKSQFDIERVDPIEYEYPSGTKMWLFLKNIKLFNLDTYDPASIKYHRKGRREYGPHQLTQDESKTIGTSKSSDPDAENSEDTDEKNITLDRVDTVWNINVSAEFKSEISSHEENNSSKKRTFSKKPAPVKSESKSIKKPIVVEAEFKIQPQKNENESTSTSNVSEPPLRASGILTLNVYDFKFEITILLRHMDQIVRENLPENKYCYNRVPDFDIQYGMNELEIKEVKLTKYDGDEEWKIEPEKDFDNVMDDASETIAEGNTGPAPKRPQKDYNFIEGDTSNEEQKVKKHLNLIREQILNIQGGEIRKRLCLNIMPKMAWKTMQMQSKQQLPGLIHQIVQYDENFKRKSYPPGETSIDFASKGRMFYTFGKSYIKSSIRKFSPFSN